MKSSYIICKRTSTITTIKVPVYDEFVHIWCGHRDLTSIGREGQQLILTLCF